MAVLQNFSAVATAAVPEFARKASITRDSEVLRPAASGRPGGMHTAARSVDLACGANPTGSTAAMTGLPA